MSHDPLCPVGVKPWENTYCCQRCNSGETPPWERACQCDLIAKVRADERSRKGTCWREAEGSQIPAGAIRVYREAGWFWEMP